jgi:uncharacterized protein
MDFVQYFPEGIAQGDAFINRVEERELLKKRVKSNQHSVLMAPRRYGKTSLVMKVATDIKVPYASIDFLAAYSEEYVRDQISDKVGQLVFEILPKLSKAKETLMGIFKKMKPEITVGAFGQKLSLSFSSSPLQDITDLLLKLDETAGRFKKRAVIFMDEFQQISQLKNYHSIEASIRHAVERSQNIAYVFSGSSRRLLEQMFGSEGRPLYRLCQTVNIERMDRYVYVEHLALLAEAKWKKPMPQMLIEQIFSLTEMHPFYINVLCQLLWDQDHMPSISEVSDKWFDYIKTQKHIIAHDVVELSVNQRKIIVALSKAKVKEIQSVDFTSGLKISASSAQQAVDVLIKKDLVYIDSEGFFNLVDPAMKGYLREALS